MVSDCLQRTTASFPGRWRVFLNTHYSAVCVLPHTNVAGMYLLPFSRSITITRPQQQNQMIDSETKNTLEYLSPLNTSVLYSNATSVTGAQHFWFCKHNFVDCFIISAQYTKLGSNGSSGREPGVGKKVFRGTFINLKLLNHAARHLNILKSGLFMNTGNISCCCFSPRGNLCFGTGQQAERMDIKRISQSSVITQLCVIVLLAPEKLLIKLALTGQGICPSGTRQRPIYSIRLVGRARVR